MELNKAAEKTFTVAVSGHVGFGSAELRAVRAHAAMLPSFPPQITLAGELSDGYRLVQPLAVDLEADEGGNFA